MKEAIKHILYFHWWIIPIVIGVIIVIIALIHLEVSKRIGEWLKDHSGQSNVCNMSEGCDYGTSVHYSHPSDVKERKCSIFADKCIVDEWEPSCLFTECVIDARGKDGKNEITQ